MNWNKKRIKELEELRALLVDVTTINRGSGCLERIQRCIKRAEKLLETDLNAGRPNFHQFLTQLAYEERHGKEGR